MRTLTPRLRLLVVASDLVPSKDATSPLERVGYRRRRDEALDELGVAMQGGRDRRRAEQLFDLVVAATFVFGEMLVDSRAPEYAAAKASERIDHWLNELIELAAVPS